MKYVPDTSVIIERAISKLIQEHKISGQILISKAVLAELEHQGNKGMDTGIIGLEEIQELQRLAKKELITIKIIGERPKIEQIKNTSFGEIDSLIRDLAYTESATLITADRIQGESAKALDIEVIFIEKKNQDKLELEKFFDETTMSVHLKEDTYPFAKKGMSIGATDLLITAHALYVQATLVTDNIREFKRAPGLK